MNILKLIFVLLVTSLIGFTGCSKKSNADKLIGKWKATDFADTMMKSMQVEVTYEFTKEKIINEGNVHGEPLPKLEIPYIIKSSEGNTIVLEATHPQSNAKGDFKIVFDGDKITMTDPGQTVMTLQKQ
jgi:hypothetical protein